MTFNTLDYLLFLPLIVILYYLLPNKLRNPLLLIGSYFFYACAKPALLLYLLAITAVTYLVGRKIGTAEDDHKKRWMVLGITLLTLSLIFYKYTDFLIGSFIDKPEGFNLIVPLGISFITFSAISYLVDIHRGSSPAETNILHFALFIAFFPKVAQGPIVKYRDLSPQFKEHHLWSTSNFRAGTFQVLYGLFMKMVLADRLAIAVNTVYGSAEYHYGATLVFATILFALQIYFDFAGYSLMAIGSARLLGFSMGENFHQPYFASSVGEFWRRWHISLNKWLTDYIYIPLGGSRCSPLRRDMNTLVTFGISGLWHGANWGYLFWGLLNGFYIVIEKRFRSAINAFRARSGKSPMDKKKSPSFLGRIITFILISFTWIFFRAQDISTCKTILVEILLNFNITGFLKLILSQFSAEAPAFLGLSFISWGILLIGLLVNWIVDGAWQKQPLENKFAGASLPIRWIIYLVLLYSVILFGMYGYGYSAGAFIYGAF